MGADMTEGTVVKWIKSEGDEVKRGDKIAEIETDKTVVEMESYNDGILKKIVVGEGVKVPVGELIAYIGAIDDKIPDEIPETDDNRGEKLDKSENTPSVSSQAKDKRQSSNEDSTRVKTSPIARRLAKEHGIDINKVSGTGPGGRITRDDVLNSKQTQEEQPIPVTPQVQSINSADIPLTTMRKAIARVTVRSKTESPHYYVTHAVDMTEAIKFREQLNSALIESGDRISINDLIIKSLSKTLIRYPKWNASFADDKLIGNTNINIGIAIAMEDGLIVPALMRVQNMTLVEISRSTKDLGKRARGEGGSLTQEEMTSGTFSTSNLGMFGTDVFAAIIVPPQSGIIAVGSVKPAPVVRDGELVIRKIMNATISADHRVGDGAEAAVFLGDFQHNLENPAVLTL